MTFNPEVRVGDIIAALYFLATVGILIGTLRAVGSSTKQAKASMQQAKATMELLELERVRFRLTSHQEREEARPVFVQKGRARSGQDVSLRFVNKGAPVTNLTAECLDAQIAAAILPNVHLGRDEGGRLDFGDPGMRPLRFRVRYDTPLGREAATLEVQENDAFMVTSYEWSAPSEEARQHRTE